MRFGCARKTLTDAANRGDLVTRPHAMPIESHLVRGKRVHRWHLRRRLLAEGLKEERCEECGLRDWRGAPVPLHLHHVNGDGDDNTLENLRMLCANCHGQTENWGVRNARRRAA
jgi:5-methylcytosine-specific restriction endonuclease McrA